MKKQYEVWFEVYGKKMKTTVLAKHEIEAKEIIRKQIIFYKVEESKPSDPSVDFLKGIFNIK
jgi:hypothetical protein